MIRDVSIEFSREEYTGNFEVITDEYSETQGFDYEVKIQAPTIDILHFLKNVCEKGGMITGSKEITFGVEDIREGIDLSKLSGVEKEGYKLYLTEELHNAYIRWRRNYKG